VVGFGGVFGFMPSDASGVSDLVGELGGKETVVFAADTVSAK
jgi:hypothetical protein